MLDVTKIPDPSLRSPGPAMDGRSVSSITIPIFINYPLAILHSQIANANITQYYIDGEWWYLLSIFLNITDIVQDTLFNITQDS